MSLVAYTASSDEDSDCENGEEVTAVVVQRSLHSTASTHQNGSMPSKTLNLPQPKQQSNVDDDIDSKNIVELSTLRLNLPAPKKSQAIIEESDDEFLHKKVEPSMVEKPIKPKQPNVRQPVKITIPSLAEFANDDDVNPKGKLVSVGRNPQKTSGLLNMLPPPKFNAAFGKPKEKPDSTSSSAITTKTTSLVPHAVANKMKQASTAAAAATTTTAKSKSTTTATAKKRPLGLDYNASDDSDNEDDDDDGGSGGDFFSLNTEDKLPEVSAVEINAMVAKKASQMAQFSKSLNQTQTNPMDVDEYAAQSSSSSSSYVPDSDEINMEALIGARAAKRARKGDIQFINISQDQVASSHDEWQRNHLQSATEHQPTGRLVGVGDLSAGTKKKHQITYLAYQAKANEAELQAMWAANRQNRRQTQSKYGF